GMRGVADFTLIQYQQNGTRRIGSARLITVRIGGVEHRLVGERKLRSPVRNKAASELFPFLIEHAGYGVAIPSRQQFARYFNEMFLIVGPAQAASEFDVFCEVIICLPEHGV